MLIANTGKVDTSMHPYSYNRLRLGPKPRDTRAEEIPAGAPENGGTPETGASPDIGQLFSMMQAMTGNGNSGDAKTAFPPEMMMLLTLMQAMRGGASGGMGMQNMLPLLSMLGGNGMPANLLSTLESASGGANPNDTMLNLLQGMMPPQTAQLMNMLSSMRKPA